MKISFSKKSFMLLFIMVFLILSIIFVLDGFRSIGGSISEISLDEKGENACTYLEGKGYKVISYKCKTEYVLTRDNLLYETDVRRHWELLNIDPADYIGDEIRQDTFIVKNHPLDSLINRIKVLIIYKFSVKHEGMTVVSVITADNKIIGGTSNMITNPGLDGGLYSLDGKTLEEVTGMPYLEWRKEWNKKFSSKEE